VCALLLVLNCANFSEKNVKSGGIEGYQGHQGYQGHVSPFFQATRHERGSAVQNPNSYDKYDKHPSFNFLYNCNFLYNLYNLLISRGQIHKHFEHGLGSIQAILAELEVFQIFSLSGCGLGTLQYALQNANIYDKYDKGYNLSNSGNHFKHTFSVI
jgi:hypothetical protein